MINSIIFLMFDSNFVLTNNNIQLLNMITLNIFKYQKIKIKQIIQQFKKQWSDSIPVSVISKGKTIYNVKIREQKLISLRLSQKFNRLKKKIIDLGDHQINTGEQPDQQYFIQDLFNNFFMFLTSGYILVRQNIRMDIIYLCIYMQIQEDQFSQLLKPTQTKYYNKLWDIILLVFNVLEGKTYKSTIIKLIEANPRFLIDLNDQREINSNFKKLKSISCVKEFLKILYNILNKRNSPENQNENHIKLIDVLFKQYIFQNSLDKKEYKKNVGDIIPIINIQNQNQILIKYIQNKQQEIQQARLKQKQKATFLQSQIKQYQKKYKKIKKEIQELASIDPIQDVIIKKCNPIHHQDFPKCTQTIGILLECNHYNCVQCLTSRIYYADNKLYLPNFERKIEFYNVKCLNSKQNCKQIITSQRFEILKSFDRENYELK